MLRSLLNRTNRIVVVAALALVTCAIVPAVAAKRQRPLITAAGAMHTLGVKSDGTAVASGWNDRGQSNVSSWRNVSGITVGTNFLLGVKTDGSVMSKKGFDMYSAPGRLELERDRVRRRRPGSLSRVEGQQRHRDRVQRVRAVRRIDLDEHHRGRGWSGTHCRQQA